MLTHCTSNIICCCIEACDTCALSVQALCDMLRAPSVQALCDMLRAPSVPRGLQRQELQKKEEMQYATTPKLDLSLKEGQTMKLNIAVSIAPILSLLTVHLVTAVITSLPRETAY